MPRLRVLLIRFLGSSFLFPFYRTNSRGINARLRRGVRHTTNHFVAPTSRFLGGTIVLRCLVAPAAFGSLQPLHSAVELLEAVIRHINDGLIHE